MIGHPLVFWNDQPTQQVEVSRGQASVRAQEKGGELVLALEPPFSGKGVVVQTDGPNQLTVYEGSKDLERIAEVDPFAEAAKKPDRHAFEKMMDAQEKDKAETEDLFEELIENPPEARPEDNNDLWR